MAKAPYYLYRVTSLGTGTKGCIDQIPRGLDVPVIVVFDISGTITIPLALCATAFSGLNNVYIFGNTSPGGIQITGEGQKVTINNCNNVRFYHIAFSLLPPHRYTRFGPVSPAYPNEWSVDDYILAGFVNETDPHIAAISWDCASVTANATPLTGIEFHNCSFRGTSDDYDIGVSSIVGAAHINTVYNRCMFSHSYTYRRRSDPVTEGVLLDKRFRDQWILAFKTPYSAGVQVTLQTTFDSTYTSTKLGGATETASVTAAQAAAVSASGDSGVAGTANVAANNRQYRLNQSTAHNHNLLGVACSNMKVVNCIFAHANRRSPQLNKHDSDTSTTPTAFIVGCLIKDAGTSAIAMHTRGPFVVINNTFQPTPVGNTSTYYAPISIQTAGLTTSRTVDIYLAGNRQISWTGPGSIAQAGGTNTGSTVQSALFTNYDPSHQTANLLYTIPRSIIVPEHASPESLVTTYGRAGTKFADAWQQQVLDEFTASPPSGSWINGETFTDSLPVYSTSARNNPLPLPRLQLGSLLEYLKAF